MRLPDAGRVVMTGPTDPIRYHYAPFIRYFMNRRLAMALRLLGARSFRRLLDAGFGGGVFLPELAQRADELHGVDIHLHAAEVERMARAEGVKVTLRRASLCDTGYPENYFDAIVCVSVLEFINDIAGALKEIHRIAAPNATIIIGLPGENVLTQVGYHLARTPDPKEVHKSNYKEIFAEAARQFRPVSLQRFPVFVPDSLALFFVSEYRKA